MRPTDLASVIGSHAPSPLELIFLNGCYTRHLGEACQAAGVPYVVCWSTRVNNDAARLFSTCFFQAVAQGVATRRLPIGKYCDVGSSTKVLTVNHVYEIILRLLANGGDWADRLHRRILTASGYRPSGSDLLSSLLCVMRRRLRGCGSCRRMVTRV